MTLINFRLHAECVRPPRGIYVKYPYGAQWGPPGQTAMQRILVEDALAALQMIEEPGTILDLPHTWAEARGGTLKRAVADP